RGHSGVDAADGGPRDGGAAARPPARRGSGAHPGRPREGGLDRGLRALPRESDLQCAPGGLLPEGAPFDRRHDRGPAADHARRRGGADAGDRLGRRALRGPRGACDPGPGQPDDRPAEPARRTRHPGRGRAAGCAGGRDHRAPGHGGDDLSTDGASSPSPRVPARAWLRPAVLLVGGLLLAGVLVLADQWIGAAALALFSVFMAYWTSPLRAGDHTPLATAQAQRTVGTAIVLWAPGDPLSSRLQVAFRSPREDVVWVNVHRDAQAQQLLDQHGGTESLPLVLVGETARP